jgi:hypothetical protein
LKPSRHPAGPGPRRRNHTQPRLDPACDRTAEHQATSAARECCFHETGAGAGTGIAALETSALGPEAATLRRNDNACANTKAGARGTQCNRPRFRHERNWRLHPGAFPSWPPCLPRNSGPRFGGSRLPRLNETRSLTRPASASSRSCRSLRSEWWRTRVSSLTEAALRLQRCGKRGDELAPWSLTLDFRSASRMSSHEVATSEHWWNLSVRSNRRRGDRVCVCSGRRSGPSRRKRSSRRAVVPRSGGNRARRRR